MPQAVAGDAGWNMSDGMQKKPRKGQPPDIVDDEMARILRGMTGAERLKIANNLFVSARRMLASHLAAEHPEWDEDRIELETARRISHGAV